MALTRARRFKKRTPVIKQTHLNVQENVGEAESSSDDSSSEASESLSVENLKRNVPEEHTGKNLKRKIPVEVSKENKKTKLSKEFFKQPTVEELNQLRETQNLFNSNLFRLQIEEILKEIKLKEKYKSQYNKWYQGFEKHLLDLDDSNSYSLNNMKWLNKLKVKLPLDTLPIIEEGFFKFIKPDRIHLIGPYSIDCAIGSHLNVDIAVEMPLKCFHKTDAFNAKYILKRSLYLCYLASKIKDSNLVEDVVFTYETGNQLKPILELKVTNHITVFVHTTITGNLFKLSKFNPGKGKLKSEWYFGNAGEDLATPFYNSCILSDLTLVQNNDIRLEVLANQSNVQDALKLLAVWLKQRCLNVGFGAFTDELMVMYVVYLLRNRKLNNAMSSYQVIRNVWIGLAQNSWGVMEKPVTLCLHPNEAHPKITEFFEHFGVVMVDVTGYYNLASFLNESIYKMVCCEAERAITYLDNGHFNSFQALFMTKMPFYRQFEQLTQIFDEDTLKNLEDAVPSHVQLDFLTFKQPTIIKVLTDVLQKGLVNRVHQIVPKLDEIEMWPISASPPTKLKPITLGLSLNESNAFSILDKGPEANLPEAAEFRKFWGEKSQLRRFQDGTIMEAVVWSDPTTTLQLQKICSIIIRYLVQKKFNIKPKMVHVFGNQLVEILRPSKIETYFEYGTGEEATFKVIQSFDELAKQLRDLKQLPLDIISVQGLSPVFRYSDVTPPIATTHTLIKNTTTKGKRNFVFCTENYIKVPYYVQPNEAIIQLGLSGKWPNDLAAILRLKAAFYLKISACLHQQFQLNTSPNVDWIDVLKDGFVFRLRVSHNKEIGLMKKALTDNGITTYRDTAASLEQEKLVVHAPKVTSALHGLHSQHPSFGSAARIFKRWLRSQLLDEAHVSEVAVDLLVASIYLSPEPYSVPVLPQLAFLRVLHKMATTNWKTEPIIVNFNNEITKDQLAEIDKLFTQTRQNLPAIFIATPFDREKSIWTKSAPSEQVLLRIGLLAKESLHLFENIIFTKPLKNFMDIFQPSLTGYNVLIHLNNTTNPRNIDSINNNTATPRKIEPYTKQSHEKIPIVDFDPVQIYLRELRESYSEYALFFHDTYGGTVICVLWKPKAREQLDFKVSHINGRLLSNTDDGAPKLVLNVNAILEDFKILGQGLVTKVDNCS